MELDKLKDEVLYKLLITMLGFAPKGAIFSGKQIKELCPCDVSPHQGWEAFFEEVDPIPDVKIFWGKEQES